VTLLVKLCTFSTGGLAGLLENSTSILPSSSLLIVVFVTLALSSRLNVAF